MKPQVENDRLQTLVREAVADPHLRIGQHVTNQLLTGTILDGPPSARLFYCDDSEFWDIVYDFIEIV